MNDYNEIPGMNWSSLKRIHASPAEYLYRVTNPEPDKAAFALGRALHCAVLEPDRWGTDFVGQPDFGDGRTKAAKAAKADWLLTVGPGTEIVSADDFETISRMADALRAHRVAGPLLTGDRAEQVVQWQDPITGLACKGRLDILTSRVVDLKSAREIHPRQFGAAAARYLYHGQIAWYHDGAILGGALPEDAEPPILIAAQKVAPWDVACYSVPEHVITAGRRLYRSLLDRFIECQAADYWPGCAPDLLDLELPQWGAGMLDGFAPEEAPL